MFGNFEAFSDSNTYEYLIPESNSFPEIKPDFNQILNRILNQILNRILNQILNRTLNQILNQTLNQILNQT